MNAKAWKYLLISTDNFIFSLGGERNRNQEFNLYSGTEYMTGKKTGVKGVKIDRKNIFAKIDSKIYKFSSFFPARYPVPTLSEQKYKFLFPVLLIPYIYLYEN